MDSLCTNAQIQRGVGAWDPDPPTGKSQFICVSIGNKQLDPTPHLENVGPSSGTLKNDSFL